MTAPNITKRAGTVAVEHAGNSVVVTMEFANAYDAIAIYEQAIASARTGELRVNLITAEKVSEH